MRRFNTRLFLWLLGGTLLAAAIIFFVHTLQTGRIARALLWQARHTEEQGHPEETVRYLGRYLEFSPHDLEEQAHLGRLLADEVLEGDRTKVSQRTRERALFVLEGVVAREPQRQDLRRLAARVALELGRAEVALGHLQQLHEALPEDGAVDALLARCCELQANYGDAALLHWQAIQHAPAERDSYVRLAILLHRADRAQWQPTAPDSDDVLHKRPEEVLDLLVANNPGDYRAYLARWAGRGDGPHDPARPKEAGRDVDEALRLAPTEADVLLAAAQRDRSEDKNETAREYLLKGRELHPDDKRLHLALADVDLVRKGADEAIQRLEEGLQVLPEQPDLLWVLANLLIDRSKLEQAGQVVVRLRKANGAPTGVEYLQGRILLAQGRWAEAARLLESNRPLMERDGAVPSLLDDVDLALARCYEHTDQLEPRLAACERLIARESGHDPAPPALARALEGRAQILGALGREGEAVAQYEGLLKRTDAPKGGRLELARLMIARNVAQGQQDWAAVETLLEAAAGDQEDAAEVPLLQARVCVLRHDLDRAHVVLDKARSRFPKNGELWEALLELAELQSRPEAAARLLKEAEQQGGDGLPPRLARLHVWASVAEKERGPFPTNLAQGLGGLSAAERAYLLRRLVEVAYRAEKVPEALGLWVQLAAMPEYQSDVQVKLVLAELAVQADDAATVDRTLADLQRIEGGPGPLWSYAEGLRLLRQARKAPDAAVLDRADKLLETAAAGRPAWAAAHLALADLEQLRNNPDQAIVHLRKAVEQRERSPRVLRQLARLLDERGRSGEAADLLRALSPQMLAEADLQWEAADLALRTRDPARAVQLAMAAVAADSTDYQAYLRRGLVLAAEGTRLDAAGRDLIRATELGSDKPEAWISLVYFLAGTGRPDRAREVMETARAKLPADQVPLALARCAEAVSDVAQARTHYREALEKRPADFGTREAAAAFYLRFGPPDEAETLFRTMIAGQVKFSSKEVAWAQQRLAELLAGYRDELHFTEALALVGLRMEGGKPAYAGADTTATSELQGARARVLATRPRRACRTQAITLLEELGKHRPLASEDQLLLARLYEADGALARADGLLVGLIAAHGDNPLYLAHHARSLLSRNKVNEAEHHVEQLEQLEQRRGVSRGEWGSVELRAHVLEARSQGDEALHLTRQYAHRTGHRPEDAFVVIACLVRQKKFVEALETCDAAWGTCAPAAIGRVCLEVLHAMRPTPEQCRRIADRLDAARRDDKGTVLTLYLADLYEIQGDYVKAQALYRQVLQEQPGNVVALNNLAWLLAQTSGDKDEALKFVGKAIERDGDLPEFLDTRAVIELGKGHAGAAVRDLEQANADEPTASRYFRLAEAYSQANDHDAAVTALRQARSNGLKPEQLHPTEQIAFRKITAELDPQ
jgi:tetratricopeptide (TPR) repeat protein